MSIDKEYSCNTKEPSTLYKIGMFASMNRVTVKALRHYDEQGLLKPAFVEGESGYRYYLLNQVEPLHQILALKNMGFSLEEIKYIQQGHSSRKVMQTKKSQILKDIADLTNRLAQLETYLLEEEVDLSTPVLVKSLPEIIAATMTVTIDSYDDLFTLMPQMGGEMERLGCVCALPEYCFIQYLENGPKEEKILIEACEAVTQKREDSDLVQFKVIPQVEEAACIFHKGDYYSFSESYRKVLKFIDENGYEICGNIRESHIDGVWNKESPKDWLSEVQIPIRKIR